VSSPVKPVPASSVAEATTESAGREAGAPPQLSAVELARAARHRKARRLLRNLAIWVGLPSLAGIVYFALLARDQYESYATLSVPTAQAVVLREFMLSRDMLAALEAKAHFSEHYLDAHDPLAGLAAGAGSEDRYHGFSEKVDVRLEQSGLLRLRVRAFGGAEAQIFAREMVAQTAAFWVAQQLEPSGKVVVVSQPSRASQPTYPRRAYGMLTVSLVSLALFAIGSLLVAAAREHAQF
jgi:capsule polysaccharide export protein KpsE/RkpR